SLGYCPLFYHHSNTLNDWKKEVLPILKFQVDLAPFQYSADANVGIYLNLRVGKGWLAFTIEFNFSAELKIYGPDLGGHGYLKISKYEIPSRFSKRCIIRSSFAGKIWYC